MKPSVCFWSAPQSTGLTCGPCCPHVLPSRIQTDRRTESPSLSGVSSRTGPLLLGGLRPAAYRDGQDYGTAKRVRTLDWGLLGGWTDGFVGIPGPSLKVRCGLYWVVANPPVGPNVAAHRTISPPPSVLSQIKSQTPAQGGALVKVTRHPVTVRWAKEKRGEKAGERGGRQRWSQGVAPVAQAAQRAVLSPSTDQAAAQQGLWAMQSGKALGGSAVAQSTPEERGCASLPG